MSKSITLLSVVALLVSLVGGVPGIMKIYTLLKTGAWPRQRNDYPTHRRNSSLSPTWP